jgi:hypothetical protein
MYILDSTMNSLKNPEKMAEVGNPQVVSLRFHSLNQELKKDIPLLIYDKKNFIDLILPLVMPLYFSHPDDIRLSKLNGIGSIRFEKAWDLWYTFLPKQTFEEPKCIIGSSLEIMNQHYIIHLVNHLLNSFQHQSNEKVRSKKLCSSDISKNDIFHNSSYFFPFIYHSYVDISKDWCKMEPDLRIWE